MLATSLDDDVSNASDSLRGKMPVRTVWAFAKRTREVVGCRAAVLRDLGPADGRHGHTCTFPEN